MQVESSERVRCPDGGGGLPGVLASRSAAFDFLQPPCRINQAMLIPDVSPVPTYCFKRFDFMHRNEGLVTSTSEAWPLSTRCAITSGEACGPSDKGILYSNEAKTWSAGRKGGSRSGRPLARRRTHSWMRYASNEVRAANCAAVVSNVLDIHHSGSYL